MLTLTRKVGEGVYIGRNIRLTILEFVDGQDGGDDEIRIGIEAPQDIAVSRDDFSFARHMQFQLEREKSS